MKILVSCQHYYPEQFRITDICERLVKRGHEVTVICEKPNYPKGRIYEGYKGREHNDEYINGVHVIRSFTVPRGKGKLGLFFNYLALSVFATAKAARLKEKFDVAFTYQLSPIMMALPAMKYARRNQIKKLLYVLDLWPDSLIAGGIRRGSLIYRLFLKISKRIYKSQDKLLVSSKLFTDYFKNVIGIVDAEYYPQYCESLFEAANENPEREKETVDFVFAGNIGHVQSVETIIHAATLLREHKNIKWHVVGDGSEYKNCVELAKRLGVDNSITFYGRRPVEEMPAFYSLADAMLVTLSDDEILSYTLPGKVQSYMAAAKPIIGAINGEARRIIEDADCGYCGNACDGEALAENCMRFINADSSRFGINAFNYCKENFNSEVLIEKLEAELFALVGNNKENC